MVRRYSGTFRNKKLNLGCGPTYVAGWVNVDGNPFRKKDLWLDVRMNWPFENGSIDGIVAAHIIEHLFDEELEHFFKEVQRVIKKGGFLHIEVPSLELLVERYQQHQNAERFNEIAHWHGAHHQLFDNIRLRSLLEAHGFSEIDYSLAKKSSRFLSEPELEEICLRPDETLTVEGVRNR